jgi:4-carboxymuconolactone decarboxylase
MTDQTENLGGRLPLLDPQALAAAQKKVYGRLSNTFVRWSDRIHFQSKTEDGKLIGPSVAYPREKSREVPRREAMRAIAY